MGNIAQVLADEVVCADPADKLEERISHEPLGVVANISAWNYPYFVGANVFVPALLTGNAVLYKPSENATLSGLEIAKMLHASGVPHDVFVPVIGGGDAGAALARQPVDGIFFTGSYATGRKIAAAAAKRMIKVQLELGGKDPVYVCDDVDVKTAAASIADGAFYNTGQSCCAVERVYVHERIYTEFVGAFVANVRGFKIGDPRDDDTYIGPLTRKARARGNKTPGHRCQEERRAAPGRGQGAHAQRALFRTDGIERSQPPYGTHARRELRSRHRHPESHGRCRSGAADERHRLRAHRRRIYPGPRSR